MAVVSRAQKGVVYVDRDGDRITRQEWERLRQDRGYTYLREYENATHYVAVLWSGEIPDAQGQLEEHWKPYSFVVIKLVQGVNELGMPTVMREPDLTHTCKAGTEQQALELYEDFLVRYCGCEWVPSPNGQGNSATPGTYFFEKGNKFGGGGDAPMSHGINGESDVGSW